MDKLHIIYDCDPGVDDYLGWVILAGNKDVDFLGVTTVPGNKGIEQVTENALGIAELFRMPKDFPISKGADLCMMRTPLFESGYHGSNGLAGIDLDKGDRQIHDLKAWDFIKAQADIYAGELTIVAVGPLTNIGIALLKYPDLKEKIKEIIIMGGSSRKGNISPLGESNIYHDPEAAKLVFESGISLRLAGLNAYEGMDTSVEEYESMLAGTDENFAEVTLQIAKHLNGDAPYDAITAAWALDPSVFEDVHCEVMIETNAEYANGVTICDLKDSKARFGGKPINDVRLATAGSRDAWINAISSAIASFRKEM